MIDEARYIRWRRASYAFFQFEPHVVHTIQSLGRIDAELFLRDVRSREIRERNDGTAEEWAEMREHAVTMGYLWVSCERDLHPCCIKFNNFKLPNFRLAVALQQIVSNCI